MFTPAKTASYEASVRAEASKAMRGALPLAGAVRVEMVIVLQIPKSWPAKKRAAAALRLVHPTTKPDIDNVEKAIFDACNGVLWADDVQVCRVTKRKQYGDAPGVFVGVEAL